jgi:uncharacterized YccA/Bax inhibitor family protein
MRKPKSGQGERFSIFPLSDSTGVQSAETVQGEIDMPDLFPKSAPPLSYKEPPEKDPLRTSNPTLNSDTFEGYQAASGRAMTLQGTVNKTGILLLCVAASSAWMWNLARSSSAAMPWMLLGVFGGFVTALVTTYHNDWSPVTAPIYALLEGLAIGGISSFLDSLYPGIAIQAAGLTFGTLAILLVAYTSGLIRATTRLTIGIVAATGAICLVYLVDIALSFFGRHVPLINDSGPWGIAISGVIVIVAALNLILDFSVIETGVQKGAPAYMEWYGAFGIMVTLIWLYLEIIRLLAKIRKR